MKRATVNGKAKIVVGDRTSHGGRVISGSPLSTWGRDALPIARKGDTVTCPQCEPHTFEIEDGCDNSLDFGAPVALEGHRTTCGAILIAEQADESV